MDEKRNAKSRKALWLLLLLAAVALCTWLVGRCYHRYLTVVYPVAYRDQVQQAADTFGVEPSLIYAVIHTESRFDPDALSSAQAKGLMQLTDDTYRWAVNREGKDAEFDPKNLYDPATNIHYGVYVLTLLGEQFSDGDTVLAAYNAGQGRVREWLEDPSLSTDGETLSDIPYAETKEYIRRVHEAQERYRRLYNIP